jgi:hypothetical protein
MDETYFSIRSLVIILCGYNAFLKRWYNSQIYHSSNKELLSWQQMLIQNFWVRKNTKFL